MSKEAHRAQLCVFFYGKIGIVLSAYFFVAPAL